ncbi:collagen-binding protein [Bacteroidia bacterium]|nr:collagen-binding protein [Bacteroidia bacterium]
MSAKKNFLLIILLLTALPIVAQSERTSVEVRGVVLEKDSKNPIEQATVRLLNKKDSTLITGVVTTRTGSFSLKNIRSGNYILSFSFVGFQSYDQDLNVTGRPNPLNVGNILLADASILLGEAIVMGKAPEVVVRNDTLEYNADSYKTTEGSVLEDLLKKMPGAEVDSDGKITVNGKEIKKVMVDGKEFFSTDPKVASKNLPANMVDKVQVLDRKSDMTMMTGFDDGDEETVINLVVKPGMKQGWFGNAFAGYGSRDRHEGNFMVNRFINSDQFTLMGGLNNTNNMGFSDLASTMFQGGGGGGMRFGGGGGNGITQSANGGFNFSKDFNKKLVITGNLRYNHSDNDAESKGISENYLQGGVNQYSSNLNTSNRVNDNFGANLRMEWKPDTLTSIIFRPDFSLSNSNSWSNGNSTTLQGLESNPGQRDSLNTGISRSSMDGNGYNLSGTLEVSRKLNNKGRVLSVSLSGGYNNTEEDGLNYSKTRRFIDGIEPYDSIIDQKYHNANTSYNYRAYLSFVEPLGHRNFLQATYSFSQRAQESDKPTYTPDATGAYSVLDTNYISSTRYDFTTQRISLSFKAMREKYNLTLGLNADPYNSKGKVYKDNKLVEEISRSQLNFSPMAQLNFIFSKQSNLRLDYNGRTSQPSMSQLQLVRDVTDPNNTYIGNPGLKPRYTNDLNLRFQRFLPEQQTAFMLMAGGNYILNDIVSDVTNLPGGAKRTTYANISGNYNANLRFMFNTPLKNRKFTINSMSMGSYNNSNSLVDAEKSNTKNLSLSERAGIDYRSNLFDFGLNGNIRYNNTQYSLRPGNNQNTYNYGGGATTTIYLPLNFKLESDITYSTNSGYAAGYQQKEMMWNASASKSFLKGNAATLRLKIYDILQQRSNISHNTTAFGFTESESNTLTSYFIVHFIYRFQAFKGGANASDGMRRRGPGGPDGPPPGGGGGRGPGGPPRF